MSLIIPSNQDVRHALHRRADAFDRKEIRSFATVVITADGHPEADYDLSDMTIDELNRLGHSIVALHNHFAGLLMKLQADEARRKAAH